MPGDTVDLSVVASRSRGRLVDFPLSASFGSHRDLEDVARADVYIGPEIEASAADIRQASADVRFRISRSVHGRTERRDDVILPLFDSEIRLLRSRTPDAKGLVEESIDIRASHQMCFALRRFRVSALEPERLVSAAAATESSV